MKLMETSITSLRWSSDTGMIHSGADGKERYYAWVRVLPGSLVPADPIRMGLQAQPSTIIN